MKKIFLIAGVLFIIGISLIFSPLSLYFQANIIAEHVTTISPAEVSLEASSKGIFTVQMKNFSGNPVKISLTADDASKVMIFPNKRTIKTSNKYVFFLFTDSSFTADTVINVTDESGQKLASFPMKKKVAVAPTTPPPSVTPVPMQNPNCVDPMNMKWEVPAECLPAGHAKTTVIQGVSFGRTIAPDRDRWSGSYKDGEVWSIRHGYKEASSYGTMSIDTAEGGEDPATYDGALSRIPGSFTHTLDENDQMVPLSSSCILSNGGTGYIYTIDRKYTIPPHNKTYICPMDTEKIYYFNTRVSGTQGCGINGKECRMKNDGRIDYEVQPNSPFFPPINPFPPGYASATSSPISSPSPSPNCTDPGDLWSLPVACRPVASTPVTVKDGIYNMSTFLPDKQFSGTFVDNEVRALRYPFSTGPEGYFHQLDRAEGFETSINFDVALSRFPGNFTETIDASNNRVPIPTTCKFTNRMTMTISVARYDVLSEELLKTYCPLTPNQTYYWNVRVSGTQNCGVAGKECRIRTYSNVPQW